MNIIYRHLHEVRPCADDVDDSHAVSPVLTVSGAHCDVHGAKPGGAPVELCVTDTGGHSWPGGGTQQGRKQPSMAISANDLMWRFFSSL